MSETQNISWTVTKDTDCKSALVKMKNIINIIIVCGVICFSCRQYTDKELVGVYVNNYSKKLNPNLSIPPEAPAKLDTLILFEDNSFVSGVWGGGGSYERETFNNTQYIALTYQEGKAGYHLILSRKGLYNRVPTPILYIGVDRQYYYKKVAPLTDETLQIYLPKIDTANKTLRHNLDSLIEDINKLQYGTVPNVAK